MLLRFICLLLLPAALFGQGLDTVYSESYGGFQSGELGSCIGGNPDCAPDLMLMYPLQNRIARLDLMAYKRFYHDSSRTKISREYIRTDDSIFLYAEYNEAGRLLHYGSLYIDYEPMVYSVLEDYDSLMNKVPKAVLAVQPIRIRKLGFWQETLNVGARAGYYAKDEPVGAWRYYSLSFFLDFDLPSQIWVHQNGEIAKRDTINWIEQRLPEDSIPTKIHNKLWFLSWENKNFMLMSPQPRSFPYEAWEFKSDGKLSVSAVFSSQSGKAYEGTWKWEKPLKLNIDIPGFVTTTLNLRYVTADKLLFLK